MSSPRLLIADVDDTLVGDPEALIRLTVRLRADGVDEAHVLAVRGTVEVVASREIVARCESGREKYAVLPLNGHEVLTNDERGGRNRAIFTQPVIICLRTLAHGASPIMVAGRNPLRYLVRYRSENAYELPMGIRRAPATAAEAASRGSGTVHAR